MAWVQGTFEDRPDPGSPGGSHWPLSATTFVVVDLETTGGSPGDDRITEVGAVKVRGGEVLGTFATLVNPGRAIPPTITVLTGISESMVVRAPRIEGVLPALAEFVGDAVVVGHNVAFDVGFLRAALERDGRPALANPTVDTVPLARRLLGEEVPNCKLSTLASRLRLPHQPSHRALDDALATCDLLHVLLERAGSLGVTTLDDLLTLPRLAAHPQAAKLRLTERLPRRPGVYLFRDGRGRVLYVGKASDLRSRVRSYFSGDDRRKVGALLREAERIDHKTCSTLLEAEVLESRLIRHLTPPYNSAGTRWRRACYLKLTLSERFPRLSVVRAPGNGDDLVIGPIGSTAAARRVAEAIESAVPLRRCTDRVPATPERTGACAPAQLGVATCPCAGQVGEAEYASYVAAVVEGVQRCPAALVEPLEAHMVGLADEARFEEAAATRDRLAALTATLRRRRRIDTLLGCERIVLGTADGQAVEIRRGVLWRVWPPPPAGRPGPTLWEWDDGRDVEMRPESLPEPGRAVAKGLADELVCVATWLERHAATLRPIVVEGTLASPWPPLPHFTPRSVTAGRRHH
jgi:DNA polymerase-3 subunit epsilon